MEQRHGLDRWDVMIVAAAVLICLACLALYLVMAALDGRL